MRSLLFVPGDSPKKLEKALGSGADVLIIDLEDSVSAAAKPEARKIAAGFLASGRTAGGPLILCARQRSFDRHDARTIWRPLSRPALTASCCPSPAAAATSPRCRRRSGRSRPRPASTTARRSILPIITETAAAALSAATYAGASRRLSGLTWGAEDLAAAIGARGNRDAEGRYTDVFRFARAMTILAASAADVAAVDTVFADFRNEAAFAANVPRPNATASPPRWRSIRHRCRSSTPRSRPRPRRSNMRRRSSQAFSAAGDPGVVAIDGKMYDRPHLRQAERLLARARGAGDRVSYSSHFGRRRAKTLSTIK